jgi:MjaI restriction endonuclease.
LKKKPDAIKNATEKIFQKLEEFKNSLNKIDRATVEQWVRDLLIVRTYAGLRF